MQERIEKYELDTRGMLSEKKKLTVRIEISLVYHTYDERKTDRV